MVEIKLNSDGIVDLLKCQEMQDACQEQADRVAAECGDGFETGMYIGKLRARAYVRAESDAAVKACYQDNVLLKALGS